MKQSKKADKKSYHHGDLRAALVVAAAKLLREEGEGALSMRRLATEVGVSRTAAYHHFKDKQDLLSAIAESGFERCLAAMRKVFAGEDSQPSEEIFRQFAQAYLEFAVGNPEYYNLMFGGQLWQPGETSESLTEKGHAFFRFYTERLKTWQAAGLISADIDPVRQNQVTMSALHGMARLSIDGIYVDRSTVASIADSAAGMLWRELQVSD